MSATDETTTTAADEPEELSAFDLPAAPQAPIDTRDIPLEDIAEIPGNIRPHHHGIERLAETMHLQGQLQPCVVRPAAEGADHGKPFELVFGFRRRLAAESLGWETLRCEVREVPNDAKRRQLIIENLQREDLSPVAKARAVYELKFSQTPPLTNAEVARQIGCDPSQVSHQLNMLTKLAPPRPPSAPPQAHELAEARVQAAAASTTSGDTEGLPAPEDNQPLPEGDAPLPLEPARTPDGALALPGDPIEVAEDEQAPEGMDLLALVEEGKMNASVAEVVASLESREDREKLAQLVIRNEWGVKKASDWARAVKKGNVEAASANAEELGPVELLDMVDVVELQKLQVRPDLTEHEVARVVLYMQLRNGMDREMLDYLNEHQGVVYEGLWDYVAGLQDAEVAALTRRMAIRYISAAHRFFDLEPTLKDALGLPESADDAIQADAGKAQQVALPGYDAMDLDESASDDE